MLLRILCILSLWPVKTVPVPAAVFVDLEACPIDSEPNAPLRWACSARIWVVGYCFHGSLSSDVLLCPGGQRVKGWESGFGDGEV